MRPEKGFMGQAHMYQHLSGYAHSSSLSILQIKQAFRNGEQPRLIQSSLNTINIVTANLVREYCELFSRARSALRLDHKAAEIVETWVQIGQHL